ncbi:hypothetical protein Drose_05950 [Dactylosporangium roseum]|uniref:DUF6879 domain-containing protein n=1 Tax=Dactylosporangium roseum TaxID=47989 RepID=A0ABY5ZBV5_9ACTN|nr:DUF6879 family protein [Dactylosporangium roseum]UWZ37814.1 hypothetical protein Drose_05950 [Dactylosporangium roseum]
MTTRLTPRDFDDAFRYFRRDAFRLEARPVYTVDVEREAFDDYLRGEPRPATDYDYYATWLEKVREVTAAGRRLERVRIIETPPTDYQAFELHMARYNVAAGETLRTISRPDAVEAGLPADTDWWLFDSEAVAVMRFADDGTPLGGTILTDPAIVSRYCTWRDLAVHHSAPFTSSAAA